MRGNGTHVGAAGGLENAVATLQELTVTAAQLFLTSPRRYHRESPLQRGEIDAVRGVTDGEFQLLVHAPYYCVISNGIEDSRTLKAVASLTEQLENAALVGACGVVVHPGRIRSEEDEVNSRATLRALEPVLAATGVPLLLENTVSGWHQNIPVLGELVLTAGVEGVGICLDTAHSYGAAVDLTLESIVAAELPPEVASLVGAVHFNGSQLELGSGLDRHGDLSSSVLTQVQLEVMYRALRSRLPDVPFVVEATHDPRELAWLREWSLFGTGPGIH